MNASVRNRYTKMNAHMHKLIGLIPSDWWLQHSEIDVLILSFVDNHECLEKVLKFIEQKTLSVSEWEEFVVTFPSRSKEIHSKEEFKAKCNTIYKNISDFKLINILLEKGTVKKVFHWTIADPEVGFLHGVNFLN